MTRAAVNPQHRALFKELDAKYPGWRAHVSEERMVSAYDRGFSRAAAAAEVAERERCVAILALAKSPDGSYHSDSDRAILANCIATPGCTAEEAAIKLIENHPDYRRTPSLQALSLRARQIEAERAAASAPDVEELVARATRLHRELRRPDDEGDPN